MTGLHVAIAGTLRGMLRLSCSAMLAAQPLCSSRARRASLWLFGLGLIVGIPGCLSVPDSTAQKQTASPDQAGPKTAPKSAEELLTRYVDAIGGEKALRALKQRTTESELIFLPQEGCEEGTEGCLSEEVRGQFVMYNTADGRMFRRSVVGNQVEERGFTGDVAWSLQTDPQWLILEPEGTEKAAREDVLLHWYLDYKERNITPELLTSRKDEVDGKERQLDGLLWKDSKGELAEREFWFDRASGLLVEEIERSVPADENGEAGEQKLVYSTYRGVDGVLVPHLVQQLSAMGGQSSRVELRVRTVTHGPIEADRYVLPTLPPPEKVADPILTALAQARAAAQAAPKDRTALIEWARKAYAAALFEEAEDAAKKTLKVDRNEPEAQFILAQIAGLHRDFRSQHKYLAAAERAGAGPQPLAYLDAWSAVEEGDWKRAATRFEAAQLGALAGRFKALANHKSKVSGACSADFMLQPAAVPTIQVNVDDKTLTLMVDTSASELILARGVAQSLLVMPEGQAPLAIGGPEAPYGQLEKFRLGNINIENVPVTMFPDASIAQMGNGQKLDGILGARILQNFLMRIDPQAQKLTLVSQESRCRSAAKSLQRGIELPIFVHEARYAFVRGAIGEHEGMYMLNTGMRGAVMMGNMRVFAIAGIGAPAVRADDIPMVKLDQFSLIGKGKHTIAGVPAAYGYLQDQWTGAGFRLDGMVSGWVFGARAWTLDLQNRQIWVDEAPPAPKATQAPASKEKPAASKP